MTLKLTHMPLRSVLASAALALFSLVAAASSAPKHATQAAPAASPSTTVPTAVVDAIKAGIAKLNPNASAVQSVTFSPIPGMYEVLVDGQLLYSDATGKNIVVGQMIDSSTHDNITNRHLDNAYKLAPNSLPTADSIVSYKTGDGSRKLLIFEDPDCGYCKHLEPELAKLKDTTVYVAMIEILGENSKLHGHAIACASDSSAAWRDWMTSGRLPESPAPDTCAGDATVASNAQLARKLGVSSTPTYYFLDGTRARGTMPADVLQARLDEIASGTKTR